MSPVPPLKLFAVCTPGLEPFTSKELEQLNFLPSPAGEKEHHDHDEKGGVEFEGSLIDVYRCNLHLHTASRLLVSAPLDLDGWLQTHLTAFGRDQTGISGIYTLNWVKSFAQSVLDGR